MLFWFCSDNFLKLIPPCSIFLNVTDAEIRIKRRKTCIFVLSKRKDITDPSHHYWIFKKYVNPCAMGENHQYTGAFDFVSGVELDCLC